MQDVARIAGVSITTVSHVINKTRNVNQETRDAVLAVIGRENYRTSTNNKQSKNKPIYIGVIIADIREDYYISVLKAIETIADDNGVSIIFCDSEVDVEKEEKNISMLLERKVDGLILAPIESQHVPKILKDVEIPVVLIDRQYEDHDLLFIGINNFNSGLLGTKYLFEKGCKNIGFIGYSDSVYTINQRNLGFKTFILNNSMSPKLLSLNYDQEDSYPLIKNFIEGEDLDGVFCATSTICYEVITVFANLPQEHQDKIRILSYDDNRWFDFLKYPVSVITQPVAEIGASALENILTMIEQNNWSNRTKRELLFDVQIIDRIR